MIDVVITNYQLINRQLKLLFSDTGIFGRAFPCGVSEGQQILVPFELRPKALERLVFQTFLQTRSKGNF